MQEIIDQTLLLGYLDWVAFVAGIAYVVLAARDNDWCWVFAALSSGVWAYQSFAVYRLASDGMLQVFYMIMAGVGLRRWQRERRVKRVATPAVDTLDAGLLPEKEMPSIVRMSVVEHALVIVGSATLGYLLHLFVSANFQAVATLPDALTTVFSVSATYLLIYRRLENWLYWIVIDLVYVWIYYRTGALLFSLLMVIYIGMAIYGFLNWRALRRANTA